MNFNDAKILTDNLREIRSLIESIGPLLDEGKDEYKEFVNEFDGIFTKISPHYTLAITGTVSSGKSTLLSSILKESSTGKQNKVDPISSCNPSNETFSPLIIKYGDDPYLITHYFEQEIIPKLENYLETLVKNKRDQYLIDSYKDVIIKIKKVDQVRAGIGARGVVERTDLKNFNGSNIRKILKEKIARSSNSGDVYGVYKAELTYQGDVLRKLNNIYFIDLFGFGDPSPIIERKYARFISEVKIDMVIYVFPNRGITDHFNKLFELPNFIDDIVSNERFIIVLNQVDSYPDNNSNWQTLKSDFRHTLCDQVPVLRRHIEKIPIFLMSAISIDDKKFDKQTRRKSISELHGLRDKIGIVSNQLTNIAESPEYYLQQLADLLRLLESLLTKAQTEIKDIEKNIPSLIGLIDNLSSHQKSLEFRKDARLSGFQQSLKNKLIEMLSLIDYVEYFTNYKNVNTLPQNPAQMFTWMVNASLNISTDICENKLIECLNKIIIFAHEASILAYREYVELQDQETISLISMNIHNYHRKYDNIRAFNKTLDNYSKKFIDSAGKLISQVFKKSFKFFINWYLYDTKFCKMDATNSKQVEEQVVKNTKKAVNTFMYVYIYGDPDLSVGFKPIVSQVGEFTLWEQLESHFSNIEEMLATSVRIMNRRIGLHIDRKYFISKRDSYNEIVERLIKRKDQAEEIIYNLNQR